MNVQPTMQQPALRDALSLTRDEDYPVREYIGSMARELAQMARYNGDDALGDLLEQAADRAGADRP